MKGRNEWWLKDSKKELVDDGEKLRLTNQYKCIGRYVYSDAYYPWHMNEIAKERTMQDIATDRHYLVYLVMSLIND